MNVEASRQAHKVMDIMFAEGWPAEECHAAAYARYLDVMATSGQYGGEPEIQALRSVYGFVQ